THTHTRRRTEGRLLCSIPSSRRTLTSTCASGPHQVDDRSFLVPPCRVEPRSSSFPAPLTDLSVVLGRGLSPASNARLVSLLAPVLNHHRHPETAGDPQYDYGVDDPSFLPEQPDVGAQEPDATVDDDYYYSGGAYYYVQPADDDQE
uniref:Uncharacterized protein n=1 Tax=Triticum urartu TaxID=4572 RepID=A0A8R7P6L1_TRIUA